MDLERRVQDLEEKVAELEGNAPEQQKQIRNLKQYGPVTRENRIEAGEAIQQIVLITGKRELKFNV